MRHNSTYDLIVKEEALQSLVIGQLAASFGPLEPTLVERMKTLKADQLEKLGLDFVNFTSLNNVATWLTSHKA